MSFRLVPKSVTLNDLERRNGRYFALFQQTRVASGRTTSKFAFAISSPDEFLLIFAVLVLLCMLSLSFLQTLLNCEVFLAIISSVLLI